MAKPLPLPVWDRQGGKLVTEWMDDHQATYESEPQHSVRQWVKSQPLFDWIYCVLRNTIEKQPYTAVSIALGIGWLLGRLHWSP